MTGKLVVLLNICVSWFMATFSYLINFEGAVQRKLTLNFEAESVTQRK